MKIVAISLMLLTAMGCSTTTDTIDEPIVPRAIAPLPTDPRVSELQVLVSELIDQVEVLNARIKKMESGEEPVQQAATRTAEPQVRQPVTEPARTQTREPARVQPPAPRTTRPSPAVSASSAPDRYRDALVLFGKGQINDARDLFQQVFDADPNGDLADNALYWVGETYFVSGRYQEAIEQYRRIETDFSTQNKAPDALLQMGLAQAKLGDLALARRTLEGLVNRYPYSTAANAAKAEIKRLRY